jgi:nicotinamide riboside kinase
MRTRTVVALLGAECTGKSSLGQALAAQLGGTYVPEYLREWCDTHGRTPQQHEQAAIAAEQARRIDAAPGPWVLADTTPLITALCSQHYFNDDSLLPQALAFQRRCDLILLCAPDLPWEADGVQRDGPEVRARFDARLRQALSRHGLAWHDIQGERRLQMALTALMALPLLGVPEP